FALSALLVPALGALALIQAQDRSGAGAAIRDANAGSIEDIRVTEKPPAFANRLARVLRPASDEAILALKKSARPGIALHAAWEQVRRRMPEVEAGSVFHADPARVDSFLRT